MAKRVWLLFIVLVVVACTGGPSPAGNAALASRFHMDIFVQGKLDVADQIISPDFLLHAHGLPPEIRGPQGVKQFATRIRAAFPDDLRITHDEVVAQGDRVVIRWTLRGTQKGTLLGVPPTGKQVTVTGIDVFHVSGGKLVELQQNWDRLGLLQQLGAVPAAAIGGGWEATGPPQPGIHR